MSAWPEPLGLAALKDPERIREFADIARQEYVAVGIRSCLHPQIDLGTEPRWGRQFHTFGNDSAFVAEVAAAYIEGFQLEPRSRSGLGGDHGQALPRRRTAARR